MTYTSGYQSPSAANASAYSPFNRAAQQPPQQPGQYAGYPAAVAGNNPFPSASPLGADTFSPANPGDVDAVSSSIDSKIADIRRAFSQPTNPMPAPGAAASSVSKADVNWAMALESKIKTQNYQPNAQETARYEQIFQALQAAQAAQTGTAPVAPPSAAPQTPAVSDQEVSWALDMEKKVKAGHTPTAQETAKYNDIFARLNGTNAPGTAPGAGSAPDPVSKADMDWARALESKVKTQNYKPTAEESARYEKIFKALQAAQQAGQPAAVAPGAPAPRPAAPTNWNQWAQPFNVPAAPTMPLPIAGPNGQAVINVPSSLVGAPQNPPAAVMNQAPGRPQAAPVAPPSQAELDWALQLETLVKQGHQPNAQQTAQYQDIAKRLQASQQPGAQQQSAAAPPQAAPQTAPQGAPPTLPPGISQQEVQWAVQLEDKVKQGYQPNAQETAQYQQIAQKVQAAQAGSAPPQPQMQAAPAPAAAPPAAANPNIPQSLPNGLTQQDIQWAMALETKVNTQQYQPTPPEMQRHANIAQRLQAAPAQQPAAMPQQQPAFQGGVQQVLPQAPRPVQIMPQSYPQVQGQAPQMVVPYQPANNQIPLPAGPQQGMPPGGPPPAAPQRSAGLMDRLGNAWSALWG